MQSAGGRRFAETVADRLRATGLVDAELLSSTESDSFGDADVVFRLRPLLLRFVRDRGQEFLDVASTATPDQFFQFGDVKIAMGWTTIEQLLAQTEPAPLEAMLDRLVCHLGELSEAFSDDRERVMRGRLERVAHDRGQAFVDRLLGR
jgi:hypothetical protein